MTAVGNETGMPAGAERAQKPPSMDRVFAPLLWLLDFPVKPLLRWKVGRVAIGWWIMWALINAITVWRGWYALVHEMPGLYHSLGHYTGAGPVLYRLGMLLVLFLSDGFDGSTTRRWGLASGFGGFVDPVADKALTISTLVAMVWAMFQYSALLAALMAMMLAPAICNDLWLSSISFLEWIRGLRPAADSSGKLKLGVLGALATLLLGSVWCLATGLVLGAVGLETLVLPFAYLAAMLGDRSRRGHLANLRRRPRH